MNTSALIAACRVAQVKRKRENALVYVSLPGLPNNDNTRTLGDHAGPLGIIQGVRRVRVGDNTHLYTIVAFTVTDVLAWIEQGEMP